MDAPKTLDLLESNPLLAKHFNTAELSVFAQYLHLERIGPATALIQEGDEAQELMVLLEGQVRVVSEGKTLATLGAGSFFGEGVFCPERKRIADVICDEDCLILRFGQEAWCQLLSTNPATAKKFSQFFAAQRQDKQQSKQQILHRIGLWGDQLAEWLQGGAHWNEADLHDPPR